MRWEPLPASLSLTGPDVDDIQTFSKHESRFEIRNGQQKLKDDKRLNDVPAP
jgi:hypothetical protein